MDIRGKKVAVVGMGQTAMALVRLLIREGAEPFVTDAAPADKLIDFTQQLDALGVLYECGGHTRTPFEGAAYVIPSPGVSPDLEPIREADHHGVGLMGEMEFAFRYCNPKILAVTGTNGKTTTTELLHALIAQCGRTVALAGNNKLPLSEAVQIDPAPEFIVLEVSSYQLETAWLFHPWIGAVLNLTPDHLERHRSLERYAEIKEKMFSRQQPGEIAVVNADNDYTAQMQAPEGVDFRRFSLTQRVDQGLWVDGEVIKEGDEPIAHVGDNPLPGRHNLENALAALTMARAGGFEWDKVLEGLRAFTPVEHRIETVATIDGVEYVNDSKATNIDSLQVALESFDRPIVLIAGGRGKGADYGVLRPLVKQHLKALVTIGEDAPLIEQAFAGLADAERAETLEKAVQFAAARAVPGDVVLLSPACASFDMFANFEARGQAFKKAVHALQGKTS